MSSGLESQWVSGPFGTYSKHCTYFSRNLLSASVFPAQLVAEDLTRTRKIVQNPVSTTKATGSSQSFSTSTHLALNAAAVAGNPASVQRAYENLCKAELRKSDASRTKSSPKKLSHAPHQRISLHKQQVLRLQALRASRVAAPSSAAAHEALAAKYGQEGSAMLEADKQRRATYKPRRLQATPMDYGAVRTLAVVPVSRDTGRPGSKTLQQENVPRL